MFKIKVIVVIGSEDMYLIYLKIRIVSNKFAKLFENIVLKKPCKKKKCLDFLT